jgi:hypothetical protein
LLFIPRREARLSTVVSEEAMIDAFGPARGDGPNNRGESLAYFLPENAVAIAARPLPERSLRGLLN